MSSNGDKQGQVPRLYVVILNWNRPTETIACLDSVARSDYPHFATVVVDNGSTDHSIDQIRAAFPDIPLLQAGSNRGYAGGNNIGLRYALEHGAEYLLLLNDDVRVEADTCTRLVAAAAEAGVAAVGCKVRVYERPEYLWAAGESFPREDGYPLDDVRFDRPREIRYAVGCCILLRREALEQIGLLDAAFFAVHEEHDWCRRAINAGYRILYAPDAVVRHKIDTSLTSNWSPTYHYLFVRNWLLLLERYGFVPSNWRRLRGALIIVRQEIDFIRLRSGSKSRRMWAAMRGAADYVRGRFGPPPADLRR
jgi:GT2 family glycosyltransferase